MPVWDSFTPVVTSFASFAVVALWWSLRARKQTPLPPKISATSGDGRPYCMQLFDYARKHGPLFTISWGGVRPIVIVNGLRATIEIFETRAGIYCTRPNWVMPQLSGRGDSVAFILYGPRLRQARKYLHGVMGPKSRDLWEDGIKEQIVKSLNRMQVGAEPLKEIIRDQIIDIITSFVYGNTASQEVIKATEIANVETGVALIPGKWLVEKYPSLQYLPSWLPGMGFKRWAYQARQRFEKIVQDGFDEALHEHSTGKSSFVSHCLLDLPLEEYPLLRSTAGTLYGAATDTMISITQSALHLLACHPDVQARLLSEVSASPDLLVSDFIAASEEQFPFLTAVIMEVHRFRPIVTILNHAAIKDDVYEGYLFPKGAQVDCNVWSICQDENVYPDPGSFRPSRFMNESTGRLRTDIYDPRRFTFGLGRRRCPGEHFANTHLMFLLANLVNRFEVLLGPETASITDRERLLEYAIGFMSQPARFDIRLRTRKHEGNGSILDGNVAL